ncbi:MAG: DUF1631 family protein [Sulfuricella sp.]|nr:DUF1631 family protein [Sulfuricella sp.]
MPALPATLKSSHVEPLPCSIVGYSQAGVQLSFGEPEQHAAIGLPGRAVLVEFAAPESPDRYLLSGTVEGVLPGSLDIEVAQFPAAALKELARAASGASRADSSPAPSPGQAAAATAKCRAQFVEFIQRALQLFFGNLAETLSLAADKSTDLQEKAALDAAFPLVTENRANIEQAFLGDAYFRWTAGEQTNDGENRQFSLVDIELFEDWLKLSWAIKHLEVDYKAEIYNFEVRFEQLNAGQPRGNPYAPAPILQAFRQVLLDICPDNRARALLYRAFFESVSAFFGDFYRELNEAVAFVPGPKREAASTQKASEPGDFAAASDATRRASGSAFQTGRPGMAGALRPLFPPSSSHLLSAASQLFDTLRDVGADGRRQDAPAGDLPESQVSLDAILAAVSRLQQKRDSAEGQYGATSVKRNLIRELPQLENGHAEDARYVQKVQLFDELVSKPLAENTEDSDIRNLLMRLELPLLKLALLDEEFLGSDAHPAHQLLDLFDRFHVAADDAGKLFDRDLYGALDHLVNRVADNFEGEPAVFDEAIGVLNDLLEPIEEARRRKIAQIQLSSESRQEIGAASDKTEDDIRRHIGGRMAPQIVLDLIEAGWRHHLRFNRVRHGEHGIEYRDALGVLDELLLLLAPERVAAEADPRKARAVVGAVSRGLREVLFDDPVIETIVRELSAQLHGNSPVEWQHFPPGEREPAAQERTGDGEGSCLPCQGDWLGFQHETAFVPYQLVWADNGKTRFTFANRSATKERTLGRKQLAQGLGDGSLLKFPGLNAPFMERSARKIMLSAYERLHRRATHDAETGLLNRKGLMNRLDQIFLHCVEEDQSDVICMMLFDQLREIHRSCDHADAEASLRALTDSLSDELGPADSFSRLGEETFVVLFMGRSMEEAGAIIARMVSRIERHRVKCAEKSFVLGVNGGIAALTRDVDSPSTLLKLAHSACMASKSLGSNAIQVYKKDNQQILAEDAQFNLAGLIDKALAENLLYLRAQKIRPIAAEKGHLPHYEILLGINSTLDSDPFDLVRAAETWKRAIDIDTWVLRASLKWLKENPAVLATVSGFSINLSGASVVNDYMLKLIDEALRQDGVPLDKIIFEITETVAIKKLEVAQRFIAMVKAHGCRVSLDDFGSGYSSFAYLKNLDVDYLKIDGAFVKDLTSSPTDLAMVKSMHEIGHSFGLKTVAEYVESPAILGKLAEIGVDYAQGYAVEKPVRLESLSSGQ